MRTHLGHIEVKVRVEHLAFYKELMTFLGWPVLHEGDGLLGVRGTGKDSVWFLGAAKDIANDHDGPGMNHLAIGTDSQGEVDEATAWLQTKGILALFETPRHRPEFAESPDQTYYQVMFESPDRILFEVVYTGPKAT